MGGVKRESGSEKILYPPMVTRKVCRYADMRI